MKLTGDDYFDSEEFHGILKEYEDAVNSGQPVFMDADELAEIADYYQMTRRPDEADKAINLALSLSPGAVAPLTYKIHEALFCGDIPLAKSYLDQIIDHDDPDYLYCKAEILLAEDKEDEADKYLRQQLRDMPPDEYQDYVVDIARIYSDNGHSEKALEWMARAMPEDTPEFKEIMGRTFFGLEKYPEAEKIFTELIDSNPFSKRYWNALSQIQFMREDYAASVESSGYAIAIDPDDPEANLAKANGLYRLLNFKEAQTYYHRYNELVPDDEYALFNEGSCLLNLNRLEDALVPFGRAAEIVPEDSPYFYDVFQELSLTLSDLGRYEEAMECLSNTDQMDCDHVQIKVLKGHLMMTNGKLDEAAGLFGQALLESKNDPKALLRIIISLYDNKLTEGAYDMFKQYFNLIPDDCNDGFAYMALCCYDLKKYDEFITYLKLAVSRNPKECKMALGDLFPEGMEPADYLDYLNSQSEQLDKTE